MAKTEATGPKGKLEELIADPEKIMATICINVASGGSLIDLCEIWGVRYGEMWHFINEDKERAGIYADALNARNEWAKEDILLQFRRLSKSSHADFYDEDENFIPMNDWTPSMKMIVKDVYLGEDGKINRITFWNKEKALELLGKNIAMFNEHHTVSGRISLEDLVNASREVDDE